MIFFLSFLFPFFFLFPLLSFSCRGSGSGSGNRQQYIEVFVVLCYHYTVRYTLQRTKVRYGLFAAGEREEKNIDWSVNGNTKYVP